MIQCQSKRSDKPSKIERFAASGADGVNMGQEERCGINFLTRESTMHEKQLLGVELVVTVSSEDCVAKDTVEIAYGWIMDLSCVEVIIRVSSVVCEAMPKVEGFFSKVVGYTEVGTFLGAEIKQLAERVLGELILGTEYAKPRNTGKLVC